MASRRVEQQLKAKQQQQKLQQGNVQITQSVDAHKSIEELINMGLRTHEQNKNQMFQQRKAKLPSSFFQPRTSSGSCKRGSSVGHSREGSSDDGIGSIGASGRQTLSPTTSIGGSGNFGGQFGGCNMGGVVHQRQASAPALINYEIMEEQHHPTTSHRFDHHMTHHTRPKAIPGSSAGLPPIAVAHNYSKSLNTVAMQPQLPHNMAATTSSKGIYGHNLSCDQLQPIAHQRSVKSCDFDAMGVVNDVNMAPYEMFQNQQPINQNMSPCQMTNPEAEAFDQGQGGFWGADPRAKSQSLDPMTLTAAAAGVANSPVGSVASSSSAAGSRHFLPQQQQQQMMAGMSGSPLVDDNLGPLPEGWAKSYDQNGDPYFIDHINKTTTWYDPRISKEVQEEQINIRHAFARNNNNNVDAGKGQMNQPQVSGYGNFDQMNAAYMPTVSSSQGMDRVQQLKMERNYMQERQQQLTREGLLSGNNPQQHSQQQYFVHMQQAQAQMPHDYQQQGYVANNDSAMEVDYQGAPPMHSGLPPIGNNNNVGVLQNLVDPSIVQDLNPNDLNPQEFDKYLQITADNSRAFGVMR